MHSDEQPIHGRTDPRSIYRTSTPILTFDSPLTPRELRCPLHLDWLCAQRGAACPSLLHRFYEHFRVCGGTIPRSHFVFPLLTDYSGCPSCWRVAREARQESGARRELSLRITRTPLARISVSQSTVHTKYLPSFAETFTVFCVNDEDNSMAVVVVTMPDRPDAALPPKIPELQDG